MGLSLVLVLIVAQNTAPILARFLWFSGQVSAVILLILSATVGFILGLLVAVFTQREERRRPLSEQASD